MPSPFPGMDPYLERASLWPNVHNSLITALRDDLAPRLRPRYFVGVEERAVLAIEDDDASATRPDVTVATTPPEAGGIQEAAAAYAVPAPIVVLLPDTVRLVYLEVRTTDGDRLVTAIELLSPFNKRPGRGRQSYERRRGRILASGAHLVEIDLLRAGRPMPLANPIPATDYRILVSPAPERPRATLYAFDLTQPIPPIPVPLLPGDEPPRVDLGAVLHALYDRAGYDLRIDYRSGPEPPLRTDVRAWVDDLLREHGLR